MATSPDDGSAWSTFTKRYFNVDGFVNQTTLGFEDGEVTRYDLFDQAAVLRDYTILLKGWQESGFSWVNRDDFIRYEYTTKFTHEVTTIEFADNQFPEPAPMETPPRYLTLSKSTIIETSKNYNLGFPFNNRQMATEAGQHEFGLFSARITQMFVELVSRLSLVKLFQRHSVDEMYHNPNAGINQLQQERLLEEEVLTTFAGNHSSFGCLPAILEAAKKMERTNPGGGMPTHVLFNAEKQLLLKFGVDSAARGTGLLDTDDFIRMYEMDFRPVPIFSTSTNKSDLDVGSLLSARMEIGNHFHAKNIMLKFPREKVCIAQQGRISVFSENANGMQDIWFTDMNMADSRWDTEGRLNENHEGIKSMFTHSTAHEYDDANDPEYLTACRVVGDMEPSSAVLPNYLLKGMVEMFLRGCDKQVDQDDEAMVDGTAAPDAVRRMTRFAARAMTVLGGQKNPLFRANASSMPKAQGEKTDTYALRRIMLDIFKCNWAPTAPSGSSSGAPPMSGSSAPSLSRRQVARAVRDIQESRENLRANNRRGETPETGPLLGAGGAGMEYPSMGLSYHSTANDNDFEIEGKYSGAHLDQDLLASVDDALMRMERYLAGFPAQFLQKLGRMRGRVQKYMVTNRSDLQTRDFKIISNVLDTLVDLIAAAPRPLVYQSQLYTTATADDILQSLDSLVTDLQDIGSNVQTEADVFTPARYTAMGQNESSDDFIDRLSAERVSNGNGILQSFPLELIEAEKFVTDSRLLNQTAIENVFSSILDYSDGSPRAKKRNPNEDPSDENNGDMANIWANVGRVNSIFSTELERGVGFMMLLVPIHRDVFDTMLANDVFIPCEYLIIRNQMTYESEGGCIVQAGASGVGRAMLSYPAAEIGKSAMDMTGMMHVAQCVSIIIPDPKKRWMIPHLFYRRALGGANAKFFTRESWDKHKDAGYFSKGYNRDSMMALSIPVGSKIADQIHVSGKSHAEQVGDDYSEAEYYSHNLGYNRFSTDSVCLHQRIGTQDANGLCYMGTYATYGMDGKRAEGFENQGHHKTERVGDKILRQRGATIRTSEGTSMFQF